MELFSRFNGAIDETIAVRGRLCSGRFSPEEKVRRRHRGMDVRQPGADDTGAPGTLTAGAGAQGQTPRFPCGLDLRETLQCAEASVEVVSCAQHADS